MDEKSYEARGALDGETPSTLRTTGKGRKIGLFTWGAISPKPLDGEVAETPSTMRTKGGANMTHSGSKVHYAPTTQRVKSPLVNETEDLIERYHDEHEAHLQNPTTLRSTSAIPQR
uniref:Uncharacterized protein n=1 Tax=Pristionchus pacificus TaxID=54126 RepID=A0A2A6BI78_PRIPA|eukprot:PDM65536.1 hypothetical protein PRIPAC_52478 [Pristionchus pacificus]